jgi:hypothetical protein
MLVDTFQNDFSRRCFGVDDRIVVHPCLMKIRDDPAIGELDFLSGNLQKGACAENDLTVEDTPPETGIRHDHEI